MSLGSLSMGILGLGSGIQAAGAYNDAIAQNQAAEANALTMERQAGNYLQSAEIERALGKKEAIDIRRDGKKVIGAQRAITGASGVKVDVGSSASLQEDTVRWVEYDAQAALYSRDVRAFQLESQADSLKAQASYTRQTKQSPGWAAASAGLSGISGLLNSYRGW